MASTHPLSSPDRHLHLKKVLSSSSFITIMKHNTLTFTEPAPQYQGQGKPPTCAAGKWPLVCSVKVSMGWMGRVGLQTAVPSNKARRSPEAGARVWHPHPFSLKALRKSTPHCLPTGADNGFCEPHSYLNGERNSGPLNWIWFLCWLERLLSRLCGFTNCTFPESVLGEPSQSCVISPPLATSQEEDRTMNRSVTHVH